MSHDVEHFWAESCTCQLMSNGTSIVAQFRHATRPLNLIHDWDHLLSSTMTLRNKVHDFSNPSASVFGITWHLGVRHQVAVTGLKLTH